MSEGKKRSKHIQRRVGSSQREFWRVSVYFANGGLLWAVGSLLGGKRIFTGFGGVRGIEGGTRA